ncbi:GTPase activating protein 1-like [Dendrobium catenatum]|uniref:GTPase activating protein 1-like n=1 Tax=Dendrobium catenatum TaxID=906689 RepID=UPI00109F7886|nr:GTPase activating protein 1-like [Dendrobium catenatum]
MFISCLHFFVLLLFCFVLFFLVQKLKTQVIKKTVNPEWDEELTFSVEDPSVPVKLEVYDKDRFSADDPMGDAEFDIKPFFEAVKMDLKGDPPPDGSVLRKQASTRANCLAGESSIYLLNGKVVQDIVLRLRNVECGEIELQLRWVDLPSSKSS